MSYTVTQNFIRQRGIQALIWLTDRLNAGDSLSVLAPLLRLSVPRLSQIVAQIYKRRKYEFSPGALDYLGFYLHNEQWHLDNERIDLERLGVGKLIWMAGGKNVPGEPNTGKTLGEGEAGSGSSIDTPVDAGIGG